MPAAGTIGLRVNRVQRFCLHDGPGLRSTVFLQGCPLRCWWCHNPETWAAISPLAREMAPAELLAELDRDALYWRRSGGGITLSGGEPLAQTPAVAAFLELARRRGHHVTIQTAGAVAREAFDQLRPLVDLWLYDFKLLEADAALAATGNSLESSRENLRHLLTQPGIAVWARVPLVANVNTARATLEAMARWLAAQPRRVPIQILPGHTKGMSAEMRAAHPGRVEPTAAEVADAVAVFAEQGMAATVSPEEPRS